MSVQLWPCPVDRPLVRRLENMIRKLRREAFAVKRAKWGAKKRHKR